jgi:GDP-L-fucose synthase
MKNSSKIFVAGHRGLVGSAVLRRIKSEGYDNVITQTSKQLDLTQQDKVEKFFKKERPEFVFLAAAKVGGILANSTYPAEFIYQNIMIQTNIVHFSYLYGVKKLLFLGSSCIYPKFCPQPMKEEYLLTGELEATNEPYAIAKISGIKMCQSYNRQYGTHFLSVMPTNLYGPHDNFNLETAHVIPAMIRKFHEAKVFSQSKTQPEPVVLWGTGLPKREFLHVDDLADACVFIMNLPDNVYSSLITHHGTPALLNIGTGKDITIKELADLIKEIVRFKGEIVWDSSKPDGTPRKLLDVSRMKGLGWKARISLKNGIGMTYEWYRNKIHS